MSVFRFVVRCCECVGNAWWILVLFPFAAGCAQGQVALSAALTRTVSPGRPDLIDREVFGLRYRTPVLAGFTAQAGILATVENGILHPSEGAGVRHWAVAGEYAVTRAWRAQLIYGNFDELRPHDAALPFTYYRFFAVGSQLQLGATVFTLEKILSAMHETHAAIHDVEFQAHSVFWDVMASSVRSSRDQAPYHFVIAEATLRPFAVLAAPFRYLGIEGGTRALPSVTVDGESAVPFLAAGLFFHASVK